MGFFNAFRNVWKDTATCSPVPNDSALEAQALQLLAQGNDLEAAGSLHEAMRCYRFALKNCPSLARAHLNLGNALLADGQLDAALVEYQNALRKDPAYAAAHFNIGNAHLGAGHLEQACLAYRKALNINPGFADAYAALGYACEELGDSSAAIDAYRRALKLTPEHRPLQHNLGNALAAAGRHDEAENLFRQLHGTDPTDLEAISSLTRLLETLGRQNELVATIEDVLKTFPESAEAHNNLGVALQAAGRPEEALAAYQQALTLNPAFGEAHFCLGVCLEKMGRLEAALAAYRQALALAPDALKSIGNLGNLLMELGRPDEAATVFEQGIRISPDLAEAHFNLGTALNRRGHLERAERHFLKALELKPEFANACNNLGASLNHRGLHEAALAQFRRAIELDPQLFQAHNNMGLALQDLGRRQEATHCFRKALEIKPDFGEARLNLALTYSGMGELDKALDGVRQAVALMPDNTQARSALLFLHNYRSDGSPEERLEEARDYGRLVANRVPADLPPGRIATEPDKCLNVGFVSGDLRRHPVGFFVEGVLAALAELTAGRLKLFAYSNSFENDAVTARIQDSFDHWTSITGLADRTAYDLIVADRIDILIDLSGHTLYSRLPLFAWRPAPVQVTWLGYFATTGIEAIDYLIADPWTLPASQEAYFTETIVRLPETRLCFTPPDDAVACSVPPVLKNGYVTFGCFNTLTKMTDAVVALWSEILATVPASKLMLMSHQLQDPHVIAATTERFRAHGVDPQRLIIRGFAPRAAYLATYNEIDIALDPFPYCGGTTSVEALWMGVPVLTLAGEQFLARQGVGLMMNAGLADWVADDPTHYRALAVAHAGNPAKLAQLRQQLRNRILASPIFDAPRFAGHFEAALRTLWQRHCAANAGQSGTEVDA